MWWTLQICPTFVPHRVLASVVRCANGRSSRASDISHRPAFWWSRDQSLAKSTRTGGLECGEMPEWSNGVVSKTTVPLRVPRVRIPVSPPFTPSTSLCLQGARAKPRVERASTGQTVLCPIHERGLCSFQAGFARSVSAPIAIGSVSLFNREKTGKNVRFGLKTGGSGTRC